MTLCLSNPLPPAGPRCSSSGSLLHPSFLCSPVAPPSPHWAQSPCSVSLPEQLSHTYKSSLQFHSFQSSLLPAPTLHLTLHKSISKGAEEINSFRPGWAEPGSSCQGMWGWWGVSVPCHNVSPVQAKRCWQGTRGRKQEHVTGEQAWVAPNPRSSLTLICRG